VALLGLLRAVAQEQTTVEITTAHGETDFYTNGVMVVSNGVMVKYGTKALLTADRVRVDQAAGDLYADGSVRVQKDDQTWIGEHIHYNYKNNTLDGQDFRAGKPGGYLTGPSFAASNINRGTNELYTTTNSFFTTDDYSEPLQQIRAREIKIIPGQYMEARNATLYLKGIPVFFFPYFRHNLAEHDNYFTAFPGDRGVYGPYLLTMYHWYLNEHLGLDLHGDFRERRGLGGGPTLTYHLGEFGDGIIKYYYTHDHNPALDTLPGTVVPENRQRFYFSNVAHPLTNSDTVWSNLTFQSQVAYQSDAYIIHDFFESEFRKDIEPNTFFDVNQFWSNWSLDALAQPRLNAFDDAVERLPDVRLNGYRQELFGTPFYYESESSLGSYRRLFSDTNSPFIPPYTATRADTFHQITMPETFFGWLNVVPRVGARDTYYGEATGPGADTDTHNRGVFNTGVEFSLKASRVWETAQSDFFDVDGLRHIVEPSVNYVYIPKPNVLPSQLPQFDYQTNSLGMLPLDFPDNNSIDAINSENTIRYGLNNRLQTKRDGKIDTVLDWSVFMDWNLRPRSDQTTFSDVYSDLSIKPRSWLTVSSIVRYDMNGEFNLLRHQLVFEPNDRWSWAGGHMYLRAGPEFGIGDDVFTSLFFYRFNENWGTRISHYFDATTGTLQEQDYSIYRDLRSWTVALIFRERDDLVNGHDYSVALSFSLKAHPRFAIGQDTVDHSALFGY